MALKKLKVANEKPDKLSKEIKHGVTVRILREQEKDFFRALHYPSEIFDRTRRKHRKKRIHKIRIIPKKQPFDRAKSTTAQYYDWLSTPRVTVYPQRRKRPKCSKKTFTPRFAHLAIPLRRNILYTWQTFYDVLTPEQIIGLKELLKETEGLVPALTRDYFRRLDHKKGRCRKKQKKVKIPEDDFLLNEVNELVDSLVDYFVEYMHLPIKYIHMLITEMIKKRIDDKSLALICERCDEDDISGRTLHELLDQVSAWMVSMSLRAKTMREGIGAGIGAGISESTISYSDVLLSFTESMITVSLMAMKSSEDAMYEADLVYEEVAKLSELKTEIDADHIKTEPEEGTVKVKIEEEPGEKLGAEVEPEDQLMDEEAEMLDMEGEDELFEDEEVELKVTYTLDEEEAEAEEEEISDEDVYAMQREILNGILDEFLLLYEEELEQVAEEQMEEEVEEEEKEGLHIEEHSPDTICCVTLKTWTTWLVDVAHNTHGWCQWIQSIIAKVKYFAALLKGQIKTEDGKTKMLYREEWDKFMEMLANDIVAWRQYNEHVQEISDKIISTVKDKRVICCSACLDSKMMISEETAHQAADQLVEALRATAYWRSWLDVIVIQANTLLSLEFELSVAPKDEISIESLDSYNVFNIIEMKKEDSLSDRSSESSIYILEEI